MGQTLTKIRGHFITRPLQRYNIESRTEKLLAKDEPVRAPQFKSDRELLEELRRERPEIAEAAVKQDTQLLSRLEKVYVTSEDPETYDADNNRKVPVNPDRPLPGKFVRSQGRPGFYEASLLAGSMTGKADISTLQEMMGRYAQKPNLSTVHTLAKEHNLSPELLDNTLTHFKIFIHSAREADPSKEEPEEHDPLAVQDTWTDVNESKILKGAQANETVKSLPGGKPL